MNDSAEGPTKLGNSIVAGDPRRLGLFAALPTSYRHRRLERSAFVGQRISRYEPSEPANAD